MRRFFDYLVTSAPSLEIIKFPWKHDGSLFNSIDGENETGVCIVRIFAATKQS